MTDAIEDLATRLVAARRTGLHVTDLPEVLVPRPERFKRMKRALGQFIELNQLLEAHAQKITWRASDAAIDSIAQLRAPSRD